MLNFPINLFSCSKIKTRIFIRQVPFLSSSGSMFGGSLAISAMENKTLAGLVARQRSQVYSAAICAVGVDREIARSSSVMSSSIPSKSGVER